MTIDIDYDGITKNVTLTLTSEAYQMKIPRDHAILMHELLVAQLKLSKLSATVSHTTVFRSKGRIITFEMSRTNGLNITVRPSGGRIFFKDTISWSYTESWLTNFAYEMRY